MKKYSGLREDYSDGLSIDIKIKNRHKCSTNYQFHDIREVCFKNIREGKCKDTFVREIICKKLFKDKYKKQK